MARVTFEDRVQFDVSCSHAANPSRRVTELTLSWQPMPLRTESDKIWRAVDFSPRYHKVRLSSPRMDFSRCSCLHERAESAKREAVNRARLEELTRERDTNLWRWELSSASFMPSFLPSCLETRERLTYVLGCGGCMWHIRTRTPNHLTTEG